MANPFLSAASNPFLSSVPEPPKKKDGLIGFAGNLITDVKDAVVGLPAGTVALIRDPVKTGRIMAQGTWQTWSPLAQGDIGKFASQFYDHPLAPILDIATVFTLGAGSAARGAGLLERAGVGGEGVARISGLRKPKTVPLTDPTGQGRRGVGKQLSTRAGRRLIQEAMLSLEPHLPPWYSSRVTRSRFESRFAIDMARRHDAKMLMFATLMKAGRVVDDSFENAPRVRQELLAGNYLNLLRHNADLALPDEAAIQLVRTNPHYTFIKGYQHLDPSTDRRIRKLSQQEERWAGVIDQHTPLAESLADIQKQLAEEQKALDRIRSETPESVRQAQLNAEDVATQLAEESFAIREGAIRKADQARTEAEIMRAQKNRERVDARIRKQQEKADRESRRAIRAAEREYQAELKSAERRVRDLERQERQAKEAVGRVADAQFRRQSVHDLRVDLERRSFADYFARGSGSQADFEKFAVQFGRRVTTRAVERAARTSDGRVYVVPKHDAHNLGREMGESSKLVNYLWRKPTFLWKVAMLGYAPRTFTNNAVGNWAMYAIREGDGIEGLKAVGDAIRLSHGDDVADRALKAALTTGPRSALAPFRKDNWLYRYFGDELGNVFGKELLEDSATGKTRISRIARAGIYPLVHKLADEPVRIAAIAKFMRRSDEVKALQRQGLPLDRAIMKALKRNPDLRTRAADYARAVAGDYSTMRPWEKVVRDIIPFYLWDRHILRTSGNLVADTPGRVAALQQLSNAGIEETEAILGEIPEFLRGALPLELLGLPGAGGDRSSVLLTHSLNPFATVGEIADIAQAATVGGGLRNSSLFTGANPIATSTVEFATGRSLLTDAPVKSYGGAVPSVAVRLGQGLPGVKVIEALMREDTDLTPSGNQYLYKRDDLSPITSFLGTPIRNVGKESAERMKERMESPRF